ncbi:MAG: bifunctional enoyl-CoA hydratase/phosphate acetyltransferase [Desulfobulbaceae bacterium]|nr:bifunctional enoyl-CoA hydratase/phosphate acetyltransferase [Candidatus Kapabacteria bacterium]MBS3998907.1 bifunctional enoyl-CoA hydratase/phosphate acetyltransferase [Desulfobulbaceae bacterium]
MEIKSLNSFVDIAKSKVKKNLVVAAAEDEHVLGAVKDAAANDIIEPIFVGNKQKIDAIAAKIQFDISKFELIEESNPATSAQIAVKQIIDGHAQILMKGLVGTADFLRAILQKDSGLRKGDLLSHIGFFEVPTYHKIIALTDAAQNIAPDFNEKVAILKNSLDMFKHLGYECPKVACLAAIEGVNPKMPSTMEAAALTQMNRRNQIAGCIIDGPLAFDNAVSKLSAEHKGIESEVAGDADLLFAPNIEVANVLYKSFTYFANATVAAIILGASVPVVLTSRSDSDKSKLMSIALAACY